MGWKMRKGESRWRGKEERHRTSKARLDQCTASIDLEYRLGCRSPHTVQREQFKQ
jgi:hypothetical protein